MIARAREILSRRRTSLRTIIVLLVLSIVVPILIVVAVWRQQQSAAVLGQLMNLETQRITADELAAVTHFFDPIAEAVTLDADLGVADHQALPRALFDELMLLPDAYSFYFGFADGGFLQVVRLPEGVARFGPTGARPPPGAHYVLRAVTRRPGVVVDEYTYLAAWDNVVGRERARYVTYDPRLRPWYAAALHSAGLASSGVYVFSGTGQPGITFSARSASDGRVRGVFGADLSLVALSRFLREGEAGRNGLVFIIDASGQLIGHPDPARVVSRKGDAVAVVAAAQSGDARVAEAVRLRAQLGDRFEAQLGPDRVPYAAAFAQFLSQLSEAWTIGVLVDESDYLARMRRESAVIFGVGVLLIAAALLTAMRVSRLVSDPVARLIEETDQIKRFDLQGAVKVNSPIVEINDLGAAIGDMKASLRSFGRYVPKEVVRLIVTGSTGLLDGERRPLTVMFSDLAGYSARTEHLPPEEVLEHLSRYFDALSKPIHRFHGTIDKFIGDSIMALWNAPVPDDDHVANACRAMLACHAAGEKLNRGFVEAGLPQMRTRFGLHTGMAIVGSVGPFTRLQYTALGAMVNLASRVEGMNKYFGTELLVTGAVEAAARERFLFRPFGKVVAVGTEDAVEIFELVAELEAASTQQIALCAAWGAAFEAYAARRWQEAAAHFESFLSDYPADGAAPALVAHCLEELESEASADGALHFTTK